jgi:hypothetical protein
MHTIELKTLTYVGCMLFMNAFFIRRRNPKDAHCCAVMNGCLTLVFYIEILSEIV